MPAGRPPLYDNPDDLQKKVDEYFEYVKGEKGMKVEGQEVEEWRREPEPLTISGLCLYIGFESRQSFYDYEEKEEFAYTIKTARLRIENGYEKRLAGQNVAGAIFALKNLGWADRTEMSGPNGGPIELRTITGMEIK